MCDVPSSEVLGMLLEAVGSSSEPVSTRRLGEVLGAQGVCRLHAELGLRAAYRAGRLVASGVSEEADPVRREGSLWSQGGPAAFPPAGPKMDEIVPGQLRAATPRRILGRGASSVVYEAEQIGIGRRCAVKELAPDVLRTSGETGTAVQKRFEREIRVLAGLSHPNIATLYTGGVTRTGAPYIAMELFEEHWETAYRFAERRGRAPLLLVARFIRAAAMGLSYAHERAGILHRDVKPANIMVNESLGTAKILDFGLSCRDPLRIVLPAQETTLTQDLPGLMLGTPAYVSYDRFLDQKGTPKSDIYSLGITFYFLLAGGRLPFPDLAEGKGTVLEWVDAHRHIDERTIDILDASRRPDCSLGLAEIVRKAIRSRPEERPSYAEFIRALDREIRELETRGTQETALSEATTSGQQAASAAGETTQLAEALTGPRFRTPDPTLLDPNVPRPAPVILPVLDVFGPLQEKMTALEKKAAEEHNADALYFGDQPLAQAILVRAQTKGLLPVLREILEADTGKTFPEFERLFAGLATEEKLPPGFFEVPLAIPRYFHDACAAALLLSDEPRISRLKDLAGRVVSFLEEALGAPEIVTLRTEDRPPQRSPQECNPPSSPDRGQNLGTQVLPLAAADPFAPGARVRSLTLLREIARGGSATVWEAHDPGLDRRVALKVLAPSGDPGAQEENHQRFIHAARLAAPLRHPFIVPIHEAFIHEGRPCLVMEKIEGTPLSDFMGPRKRIPPARALRLLRPVATALAFIHQKGIVHRDIKPQNILIDPADRPVLIDFGITKSSGVSCPAAGAPVTEEGTFLGTPHYASPEQSSALPVGSATDVYSLGATLYEMLSGIPPFSGPTSLAILHRIADPEALPEPLGGRVPGLDPEVAQLVQHMMAKHPEDRPSAEEVVHLIDQILGRLERSSAPRAGRQHRLARAAAVAVMIALGILGIWFTGKPKNTLPLSADSPKGFSLRPEKDKGPTLPPEEPKHAAPVVPALEKSDPALPEKEHTKESVKDKVTEGRSVPPPAGSPKAPPPYKPTEAELRYLGRILETVRNSLPARSAYAFGSVLDGLARLEGPENTPWTRRYFAAERERLEGAARITSRRPLFPGGKETRLILRDGTTRQGRVISEDSERVGVLLSSGLSETIPLHEIAPVTLAASLSDPWEAFILRAASGDAAGALGIYESAPEELVRRIEEGHLPGLIDQAIEEAFQAGEKGRLDLLERLEISKTLRAKIPQVLGERLARLDLERVAAALYEKRGEKEARVRLLSDHRKTYAGLRLSREILDGFAKEVAQNEDRELVEIARWVTWAPDSEHAPGAWFDCDQGTKTFVIRAEKPEHRALIKKKLAGSKKGFDVRLRIDHPETTAIVGWSLTRWVEIAKGEITFYSEGHPSGKAELPPDLTRYQVGIIPDLASGENLVYVNGSLTFSLVAAEHPMEGGMIVGASGGTVRLESATVRDSTVSENDE